MRPGVPEPVSDRRPRVSVAILDQPLILESIGAFERKGLIDPVGDLDRTDGAASVAWLG